MDICFGHRAKTYILYSSSASVTFTSAPRRFYLPPNNDPSSSPSSPSSEKEEEEQGRVTRNMIYIKVAEMVAESAKLPLEKVLAEIPFSLYQGANGYIQHLIPNDDELFEFDRYGGDTLLCIWSEEAFHREFFFQCCL